ncbi:methyltransferase domain-containing protein [bacterium]|nr:methyltransferase domain-containing protein [bacterium]
MEKTTPDLNAEYWSKRYEEQKTGWDIGYASPALIEFAQSSISKDAKILIPGAGRAYEAEELYRQGYTLVYAADFSRNAKDEFLKRVEDFPESQFIVGDFFELDGEYDYILEQTFFCALNPTFRKAYVRKMADLLKPKGVLAGLLFNFELDGGPPFGGSKEEYESLFKPDFNLDILEDCRNSIEPRKGSEYFFKFSLRKNK